MTINELLEALQGFDSDLDVRCPAWQERAYIEAMGDDVITEFNPECAVL